ncbi:MAG: AAA family ATPase [Elusimicrobiales bacterium]
MASFESQIIRALQGRHPIVYVHSSEEDRVIDNLRTLLPRCFANGTLTTWSCVYGFNPPANGVDTRDPVAAIQNIITQPRRGFYVMKDLPAFMTDPRSVRGLREAYSVLSRNYQAVIVITSAINVLPESLEKEIFHADMDLPSPEELSARVLAIEKQFPPEAALPAAVKSQLVLALRGMTLKEVDHVMFRTYSSGASKTKPLDEIFAEKAAIAKKAGFLEYVPIRPNTSIIGGAGNIKTWAMKRKDLFTQASVDSGMPIPKGILIMGVSGCGKSLLAKAIPALWDIPLFRLNMSLIFSGAYGSPEEAFNRALNAIESVAPAVLWIDEMESALSTPKEAATAQSRVFSAFLTWMQEKPPLVFVAATANRIEMLPAEIIRKGRFDQVFFCDLPDDEERAQIFNIHLTANSADPKEFKMKYLVHYTNGWSGAEIEQAVIAARIEARQANRAMNSEDVWHQTQIMVPLSKTMAEQVKAIRDWAAKRATPAAVKALYGPGHAQV